MAKTQAERNKEWEAKNREQSNYIKSKSSAKSFIRNKATLEDIANFRQYLDEREEQLKKEK